MLPVNEIFDTLQGEAHWTGTPSVFLRLQGCPVGCPWCDTKHTWDLAERDEVPMETMVAKPGDVRSYARMDVGRVMWMLVGGYYGAASNSHRRPRHVVITGGEPCLYDLTALSAALILSGRTVQVETSGTHEVKIDARAFVTVSPKFDMPGGFAVRDDALVRANEIKMVVGKLADVVRLEHALERLPLAAHKEIWLQPVSQSPKATPLCIEQATARGWKVSLQVHKYVGLR